MQSAPPAGFGGYLPGTHYDFEVDALVVAPYAHIVWALGAATDITTGLRFERTEYDYTNNTDTGLQGKLFRPASQSNSFSDLSPKLGLLHRLNENARLFVNLARAAVRRKSLIYTACAMMTKPAHCWRWHHPPLQRNTRQSGIGLSQSCRPCRL